MPSTSVSQIRCPHVDCPAHGRSGKGNIALHGFSKLKQGARLRRYRCTACGKTFKTRRKDRVVKVDRRLVIGSPRTLEDALERSEDSETLNTSFIERLNLTLRQGTAYLCRRSASHARANETLSNHLELLRCFCNFCWPHHGLKFGKALKTPAMQAGLASRRLSFREIFEGVAVMLLYALKAIDLGIQNHRIEAVRMAA